MSFITQLATTGQTIPTDGITTAADNIKNKNGVSGKEIFGNDGIITTAMNLLTYAVGLVAIVMLIVGGIKYAISAGDEKKVTSAKHTIMYALIGLAVAVLAWTLANFVFTNLKSS